MEPTANSMRPQAVNGQEPAGLGRSPLKALQSINFQAELAREPGKFLGLLRAETVRVERAHQVEAPRSTRAQAASDTNPAAAKNEASAQDRHRCTAGTCGNDSPQEDESLPPAAAADSETDEQTATSSADQSPSAEKPGNAAEPDDQEVAADADETVEETVVEAGQATDAAPLDETRVAAEPVEALPTDEAAVAQGSAHGPDPADTAGPEGEFGDAEQPVAEPEPATATAGSTDTGVFANAAAGQAADRAGQPMPEDVEVAKAADVRPADRAAERVAANLARNPEAAAEGLRRAQEAMARQVAPATPEAGAAARSNPAAAQLESRTGQAVALDLRAVETTAKPTESASATRNPELPVQSAPRAPLTTEIPVQIRMPTVAADQVEKALAARKLAGEGSAVASAAKTVGAAPVAAAMAAGGTTSPAAAASVSDAARAALQQVRASFARPGWDTAMAQRIAQMAARGVQSAQIEVDPPELGPVKVVIQVNNDQQTSVSFSSPNAGVREALESTAQRLREAFAESGLDLADVDVSDQSADEHAQEGGQEDAGPSMNLAGSGEMAAAGETTLSMQVRDSDALVDHYV